MDGTAPPGVRRANNGQTFDIAWMD